MLKKHLSKLLISMLSLLLVCTFQASSARNIALTAPTAPEPPYAQRQSLFDMPGLPGPSFSTDQLMAAGVASWEKVVFQSLRDNNWEIYLLDGSDGKQTRLTVHSANDIHPRLNRDATQVVFASKRTGHYEIFRMRVDGTNLIQLTNGTSDNGNPSWSPDGSRIAFESYRDGQAEVYVMNTDGSNPVRLTVQNGYDGQPTWSPNGNRIAFVSSRDGGDRIWMMDADGHNPVQISSQAYSRDPIWSPDGDHIAYDADYDQDGWLELMMVDLDSGVQQILYDAADRTDVWARSWSPDGSHIAFTRISFVFYEGNWYWLNAYLEYIDSQAATSPVRISSTGVDWYPDWRSTDVLSPVTRLNILPDYCRASNCEVSWSGFDNGSSGIATYEVQSRVNAGEWTPWLEDSAETTAPYVGVPGALVEFRVRARDFAGNVGVWSTVYDRTTLYSYEVTGIVRDHRDAPIVDATLVMTPASLNLMQTDTIGHYKAYLAHNGLTRVGVSAPGYSSVEATLSISVDREHEFWLSPDDNVVKNGDFELSGELPLDWQVNGSILPRVVDDNEFTRRLLLGQDSRFPELWRVSNSRLRVESPSLAFDMNGNLHIVWRDDRHHVPGDIMYSTCSPDGMCEPQKQIFYGETPSIAVGTDNVVHLVWFSYSTRELYYARRTTEGTWELLDSMLVGDVYAQRPKIALDSHNLPHIAWHKSGDVYHRHLRSDGAWSAAEQVGYGLLPSITVDAEDKAHFVWTAGDQLGYSTRTASGEWSTTEYLAEVHWGADPVVSTDQQLRAHIVWQSNGVLKYIQRDALGQWLPIQTLFPGQNQGYQDLTVMASGDVVVSWFEWDVGVFLSYLSEENSWAEPFLISETYQFELNTPVSLAVSNEDKIGLAMALSPLEDRNDTNVFILHTDLLKRKAGDSLLHQRFSVLPTLAYPTLSFLYTYGVEEGFGEPLRVYLDNGSQTWALATITTPTNHTHFWMDMSGWIGQEITLTFALSQTLTKMNWAYLDQVSLGSTYPDLWVIQEDVTGLPGDQVVYSINYGNYGSVPASDVNIIEPLPEGLILDNASPSPVYDTFLLAWQWDLGDLPAYSVSHDIVITATVHPSATPFTTYTNTLTISSSTLEGNVANNVADSYVLVECRTYLPVVLKNNY